MLTNFFTIEIPSCYKAISNMFFQLICNKYFLDHQKKYTSISIFVNLSNITVAVIGIFVIYKLICSVLLRKLTYKICGRVCSFTACIFIVGKEYAVTLATACLNLRCSAKIIGCSFGGNTIIAYIRFSVFG